MMFLLSKGVAQVPSPNFTKGRGTDTIRAIVVHKSEGDKAGGISWLTSPASQVSAHFFIGIDGSITQLVSTDDTAWHAGVVDDANAELYIDKTNPNTYTVGIELEGFAANGTPLLQVAALTGLLVDLCHTYSLVPDYDTITYHRHWDKQKLCPGPWLFRKSLIESVRDTFLATVAGKLPLPQ